MASKQTKVLIGVLVVATVAAGGAWIASTRVESPADAAARAAPPKPSPILASVERRVLSSTIVTRGTARFGLPQPVSIAPSSLKPDAGLIAGLPKRNDQLAEGDVVLSASGRPVFLLMGEIPAYRDLTPETSGKDVRQLEEALARLGFNPGKVDGTFDHDTSNAVAEWYRAGGWEPFAPTRSQVEALTGLERDFGEARKAALAAEAAAKRSELAVKSARASAASMRSAAGAEIELRKQGVDQLSRSVGQDPELRIQTARAAAEHNNSVAAADVATAVTERARIVLDPRQPKTARQMAETKVEMAKAAAERTRLEGELAVRAAMRESEQTSRQFKPAKASLSAARAAFEAARLEGERAIQAALDDQDLAKLDASLAAERADRLEAQLSAARAKLGVQVPADEIVFMPNLPVRVEEVMATIGGSARGTVMSVTDNHLAIDSSLPLDAAQLVKPGMPVFVDERTLGVQATGTVNFVASSPGTRGVDGYHVYFEVRVEKTDAKLEGFSLRLKIPIESTGDEVTVVPVSALSLSADGESRVQIAREDDTFEYVIVEPGLSADGFVEVKAASGAIEPGQQVVVGYENPGS